MAQRGKASGKKALSRVAGAVRRTAKKVTARLRPPKAKAAAPPARRRKAAPQPAPRRRRVQPDIPAEALNNIYTPAQTSLKAPFRASGADRQRDQEFSRGGADDRWNDEDHLTNKSGDPRIGTHGRTYEPGE